ncbi:MAG TPA: hypothetical protein VFE36_04430 [Candidatus Baltobacteraceae bacterium]|nr:hypothetical protein [Candidatus Baltobacteraceae bacterium]
MIRRLLSCAVALLAVALVAAGPAIVVTGQLLAYQDGYVFFTTGDGFHVSPNVLIHDAKTNGPTKIVPAPRLYARATFDSSGTVTQLDLSRSPLPQEGSFDDVARFAVALSSPVPNPDLIQSTPAPGQSIAPEQRHFSGRPVLVTFTTEVPPNTPFTATVYITTDASGWNAQAIPMDRIDTLHYQITRRLNSGTIFRYLYDRGSFQSVEVAQNGLQRVPRSVVVTDADVRGVADRVFAWIDTTSGSYNQTPTGIPTPYNPAPFPNLPGGVGPPGVQTPCPGHPRCPP